MANVLAVAGPNSKYAALVRDGLLVDIQTGHLIELVSKQGRATVYNVAR